MNTISDTSSKIGHDFRKQGVSKIEVNLTKNVLRTVSHCILRVRGAPLRQKLGMILEKKVVQKLKLEILFFYKKWSPKLIFLNDFLF